MLQIGSRLASALCGLVWARLLTEALGEPLLGLFFSFQAVAALGGLGDLGLGGAVAIHVGQQLGRGKDSTICEFLSGARALFLTLALLGGGTFLIFSPWLPHWLRFKAIEGAGSLVALFMVGALAVSLVLLASYMNNLNYACANTVWPVAPLFLIGQGAWLAQWLLARHGSPLWVQFLPHIVGSALALLLHWSLVRISHRPLSAILPMRFDTRLTATLGERSFWVYLCSLGNVIYTSTDRLIINAGFGSAQVPRYQFNYRLCELALFAVVAAGFVSMPKITQWLGSPRSEQPGPAGTAIPRPARFPTALGCVAAFLYLAVNDWFMTVWFPGRDMRGPLLWQIAFACNLAITAGGGASVHLPGRVSDRGFGRIGAAPG